MKPAGKDDDGEELKDYLSEWTIRSIIKEYSDFVTYPIYVKDAEDDKKDEKEDPVNSMKALWTRPQKEITDEEFNEFYRHISHDWEDPLERIYYKAEGMSEFRALLFIPSRPPMDLFYQGRQARRAALHPPRIHNERLQGAHTGIYALHQGGRRFRGSLAQRLARNAPAGPPDGSDKEQPHEKRCSTRCRSCARTSPRPTLNSGRPSASSSRGHNLRHAPPRGDNEALLLRDFRG